MALSREHDSNLEHATRILERLLRDREFRELFFRDMAAATREHELSAEDRELLGTMDQDTFARLERELGELVDRAALERLDHGRPASLASWNPESPAEGPAELPGPLANFHPGA